MACDTRNNTSTATVMLSIANGTVPYKQSVTPRDRAGYSASG
jgi:hypothetical protein